MSSFPVYHHRSTRKCRQGIITVNDRACGQWMTTPASCQQTRLDAANALILHHLLNFWACNGLSVRRTIHEVPQEGRMASQDFRKQVAGYGLTTASILYRRPDHPWLLQTYVWQAYDLCPHFPELQRFLGFWQKSLEGMLHSVTVAHSKLIKPAELRAVDGVFRLH